jgi:cell division protein FtsW
MVSWTSLLKILIILGQRNNVYNPQKIFLSHGFYIVLGWFIIKYIQKQNEKTLERLILLGFSLTIFLLILVLFIGPNINGTKRWLSIFGISIQPSCFILLFFPYVNGVLLYKKKFIKNFIVLMVILFLLMMEPDFGSSLLLLGVWIIQGFYLEQLHHFKKYFLLVSPVFVLFLIIKGFYAIKRIQFILKPTDEINQTNLAIKAIGFSKMFGNKATVYIPEMHNDYFFSAFTNVYGKLPAVGLLIIWGAFLYTLLKTINHQKDLKIGAIMMGWVCLIGGQSLLHIFTNLNLIPAKGISFPLLSAGGSLLLANITTIGFVVRFLMENKQEKITTLKKTIKIDNPFRNQPL